MSKVIPAAILGATLCASPLAADPWDLIRDIGYEESEANGEWKVTKTFPEALRAGDPGFEISGYFVPVQAQPEITSFLLVPDPADCPFCGSNGYGISLEVTLRKPIPDMPEGRKLSLRGTLN